MSAKKPKDHDAPGFHTPVGTRRKFFQWVTRAAAGLTGLSLAIPLAGYVISPALKRRDKPWLHLMPDLQILKPAVERITPRS